MFFCSGKRQLIILSDSEKTKCKERRHAGNVALGVLPAISSNQKQSPPNCVRCYETDWCCLQPGWPQFIFEQLDLRQKDLFVLWTSWRSCRSSSSPSAERVNASPTAEIMQCKSLTEENRIKFVEISCLYFISERLLFISFVKSRLIALTKLF